ncbi:helix-turn-helix domain-containing protein [Halopseudomonas pelagia]|uniref:helix-turn-helix domain-containing protein n=1 Tax=Halopseudomonas pelagia TaxID=553151 RepID=UPI00039BA0E7|nr:helix-turn-helix domain-containing protein [Halopseudomonas pelagia]|tara:strand:+ start:2221 stop:2574 length:354 start_codon:yes stop_codon:yes gene_type:complete
MSKNINVPFEFDAILGRLMDIYQVKKHIDLCKKLNLSPQTLSTWRGRNKVPFELCVKVALDKDVSLDWLLLGRDEGAATNTPDTQNRCALQTVDALRMHELEVRIKELEYRVLHVKK